MVDRPGRVRSRPPLFRALGRADAPLGLVVDGRSYQREAVLKHDSWAATARYAADDGRRIACKFNRRQPLLVLPGAWVGRWLAAKEARVLRLMAEVEGFPRWAGEVSVDGVAQSNAVAHPWIPGAPFHPGCEVDDEFFPRLKAMLVALHERGLAYVDLGKAENILVGDDGRPYLLDFQLHWGRPRWLPLGWWLRSLQATDLYHLHKHWSRARPDQLSPEEADLDRYRPWLVRVAHRVQPHTRAFRRRILVLFRVRSGGGRAVTETDPEEAVKLTLERS